MSQKEAFQPVNIEVRLCPVCGGFQLGCNVLVNAFQDPDGAWYLQETDEMDLIAEMKSPDIEVYCLNPHCGDMFEEDGTKINLLENEDLFHYWVRKNGGDPQADISFDDLDEEMKERYTEWEENIFYQPWRGLMKDTLKL